MALADEIRNEGELADLRQTTIRLSRQLAQARAKNDKLVEVTFEAARDAILTVGGPKVVAPEKDKRKSGTEIALWHMTDWQGAKVTTSYNTEIMRERVHRFADKAERITKIQRADHPVKDVVILFGGDMVEGMFNFPSQVFEIDSTLFVQWVNVSNLLAEIVGRALSMYEHVTVISEWGNHGRVGSKRDVVPRSDNFDRMCYQYAITMLKGEKRLTWIDGPDDIQRVEIGNYRALLMHGDEIGRNGFATPQTIVQHANRWRSGAFPWEFRDLYVGHYHTHQELPMANGAGCVYMTGSTESDNRYAREQMAASAVPSQRLHFIDPVKGRVTAQYKIHLDS